MRRATIIAALAAAVTTGLATAIAGAASVELRGGAAPVAATNVALDTGGVRYTTQGGVTTTIPWDIVRDLSPREATAAPYLEIASDLWRARSRVQRNDVAAARPLLEKHFERFRGTTSETALIVAEGLLRCRLASDDWTQALVPALEVARLRRANVTTDRYASLVPVLDDATLLCPQLAPAWTADERSKAMAEQIEKMKFEDAVTHRIAALYVKLLRGEAPSDEPAKDEAAGSALLHAIARLETGDDAARARAAKDLGTLTKSLPEWARAWANHAVGRTALASGDPKARIDGILALLRVAAQPGAPRRLVRTSIDMVIPALKAMGDSDGVAALERERATLGGGAAPAPTRTAPPAKPAPPTAPAKRAEIAITPSHDAT